MELKDYLKELFLIYKISRLPLEEINANVGYLRLLDISLYEPCLLNYEREIYNMDKMDQKKIYLPRSEENPIID